MTTFRLTGTPPVYAIPLDAVHWDLSLLLYLLPAVVAALAAIAYVRLFPSLKGAWAASRCRPGRGWPSPAPSSGWSRSRCPVSRVPARRR